MKTKRSPSSTTPVLVAGILLLCFGPMAQAKDKPDYLGEICWLIPDDESGLTLLKLGISEEGDGHNSVNGLLIEEFSQETETPMPVNGNMESIGDELVMALTITDFQGEPPEEEFASTTAQLRLDGATLNGTFHAITILYNPGPPGEFAPLEYGRGTVLFLPDCVVP